MKNNNYSKSGYIHLYNPKKEGLGSYDYHYINAYKRNNKVRNNQQKNNERYAA